MLTEQIRGRQILFDGSLLGHEFVLPGFLRPAGGWPAASYRRTCLGTAINLAELCLRRIWNIISEGLANSSEQGLMNFQTLVL